MYQLSENEYAKVSHFADELSWSKAYPKSIVEHIQEGMIFYVLSIGKTPVWECNTANQGSKRIAEHAGFSCAIKHAVFMKSIAE